MVKSNFANRPKVNISLIFLAGVFATSSAVFGGKPTPRYLSAEMQWSELTGKYADKYGAVQLTDDVVVEVSFGTNTAKTKIVNNRTYAIFDVNRADYVLNQVFSITPGFKLKEVHGWSYELGGKGVKWAEGSDVHKRKTSRGFQEVRVALPSLGEAGICGIQTERQLSGAALIDHDFMSSVPLIKGDFSLILRGVQRAEAEFIENIVNSYWIFAWLGDIERIPPQVTSDGLVMSWTVRDLSARVDSPLASSMYDDRSELFFSPRTITWADWVKYFADLFKEAKLPKQFLKAARDTLKNSAPLEVIQAVARHIDDPSNFRMYGSKRSGVNGSTELAKIISSKEGSAFSKTLLAHTVLRDLGIKNYIAMAVSLHETRPDWRFCSPYEFLDAALIWVPEIHEDFIWDVASKSVPLGSAAADLYSDMLIIDPTLDSDPFVSFPIRRGEQIEDRKVNWSLDEAGILAGEFSCWITGWPTSGGLDPWDSNQNLGETISSVLPSEVSMSSLIWNASTRPGVRITPENPAVLSGKIETEALPYGDSQWEIRPFFWPLPAMLDDLVNPLEPFPVLLPNKTVFSDSVFLEFGTAEVKHLTKDIRLVNPSGVFIFGTKRQAEGVLMTRMLSIKNQHIGKEDLHYLSELCRAWIQSAKFNVVVE